MIKFLSKILLTVLIFTTNYSYVIGQQLNTVKVFDQIGLTRAYKNNSTKTENLQITLAGKADRAALNLVNIESGQKISATTAQLKNTTSIFTFSGVSSGNWQIKLTADGVKILDVQFK